MFSEWVLGLWSLAGIIWWLISLGLVRAEGETAEGSIKATQEGEMLSIFKPLPLLKGQRLDLLEPGLESFISELDDRSELLLGIHQQDFEATAPFLERTRARFPEAKIHVIFRSEPDEFANPKIAWQKFLAEHALGELWIWSDADVVAPRGFLQQARQEYAKCGAPMLTFPYVVRRIANPPGLLDALFVNAEFYPGVLLLRRGGLVDFGLGAGMLFRRSDFLHKVEWTEIGSRLADDFMLGQTLSPVRLSRTTLVITAAEPSWKAALLHHLRWSKTVWWNRPAGAAARIVILPVAGWMVCVILHPTVGWAWLGLLIMLQIDVGFSRAISRAIGCPWRAPDWLSAEGWGIWRVLVWVACWFPWPVVWAGRRWRGPKIAQ